jgi:large subunit ribosomal protein L3
MNQSMGLVGRKIGMTQYFEENGEVVPVTVIELGPCTVLGVKTVEGADGYNAIQLGYGSQKVHRLTKPQLGQLAKVGLADNPPEVISEIRVTGDECAKHEPGKVLGAGDVFKAGTKVDVVGTSKGKGFQGVMKKYNFAGFERSHGVHEFFRHGGSIGCRLTPGHVLKGKKMPGQMGNAQVTVQNLDVSRVDGERNLVFVRGGVPGPKGAIVTVRHAIKA